MHEIGLSDSDLSADVDEGIPEKPSTPKMPSSSACASNDLVFQFGQHKGQTFHEGTKRSPSYFLNGRSINSHPASS